MDPSSRLIKVPITRKFATLQCCKQNIKQIICMLTLNVLIFITIFTLYQDNITIPHNNNIITQLSQIKQLSCNNPIYFIWFNYNDHIDSLIRQPLISYGFTINCSNDIQLHSKIQYCLKYNGNIYIEEFCNGGYLIHPITRKQQLQTMKDYKLWHMFVKTQINKILTEYCNNINKSICNFQLLGYEMDNPKQRIEFLTKHINNKSYHKTWVFKEHGIHGGQGVHFINNYSLIYSLLMPDAPNAIHIDSQYFLNEGYKFRMKRRKNNKGQYYQLKYNKLLVQEFISNPLLIEDRAFHIRASFLIPSLSKPFIVLYYPQGQIFRNPSKYENKELNSKLIKSNYFVSVKNFKKGSDFKLCWGYNRFQIYLDEKYDGKFANYTNDKLQIDIKHIAKHLFNANKVKRIDEYENVLTFFTFCIDIVITDTFELKFLEMNIHCGLWSVYDSFEKPLMDKRSGDMMVAAYANETADILLEIQKKKYYNVSITNIDSLNKIEVVYWT